MEEKDGTINLGVLGEKSDILLDRTINYIITGSRPAAKNINYNQNKALIDSIVLQPFSQEMFVENFR